MLFSRRNWLWSSATEPWRPLGQFSSRLHPSAEQRLRLRTRRAIPKGWYLFGIRHRGENRRCTGWIRRLGQSQLRQGRPMYPVRRRWRVLRLAQGGQLELTLERVQQPLQLQELWLIRLPAWDAWRRIKRRLNGAFEARQHPSLALLWRRYNELLHAQARKHSLVPYARWQRLIEAPAVAALPNLSALTAQRLHIFRLGEPAGAMLDGDWLALLPGEGYQLSRWADRAVTAALEVKPDVKLLYGDEDQISPAGERCQPQFKPAWNQELCTSDPHYSQCWFVSAALWNQWREQHNQQTICNWQELVLGLQAQIDSPSEQIGHIPMVLCHRSSGQLPKPLPPKELERLLGSAAQVQASPTGLGYQMAWPLPDETTLSLIIPTRDRLELLEACLASIERQEPGCALELVVADNGSREPATLDFLETFAANSSSRRRQIVVRVPGPFNYSAINNRAAEQCRGSVLLLLNNDVEFLRPGWGKQLASNALRPGIGCVGAQLLYPDRTIQHAGVVLGVGGLAGHAHQDLAAGQAGYQRRLDLSQELSAVTAACLAISREHWQQLGGLDESQLAVNYNDVDLCLRAGQLGLKNLYLPQVLALHHESKSRGRPEGAAYRQWRREWSVMERRWGDLLQQDPAYHPHLSLEAGDFSLALRRGAPRVR
ncbi:MAG: glycosyltransferase family 2 protein [Synechococcus sp. WH 8007]|nr:glycosyltransferase family 2 protein [Synechococcus sp. WH 8007]